MLVFNFDLSFCLNLFYRYIVVTMPDFIGIILNMANHKVEHVTWYFFFVLTQKSHGAKITNFTWFIEIPNKNHRTAKHIIFDHFNQTKQIFKQQQHTATTKKLNQLAKLKTWSENKTNSRNPKLKANWKYMSKSQSVKRACVIFPSFQHDSILCVVRVNVVESVWS